jgi:Protein of unknown function (DUF1275)
LNAHRTKSAVALLLTFIAGFLGGSIVGRAVIEAGARLHFRRVASVNIAVEALLLASFIPISRLLAGTTELEKVCALLGLLAVAMGLQTATRPESAR